MTTQNPSHPVPKKDVEIKKKEGSKKSPDNMSEIDEHIVRRFEIKKRLGKGAYGIVWKAVDRKSKEVVAIKKIFDAFRNQTDAQRTFREIIFLQSLRNHPNIVKLHSIHRAANNRDIYLGFEYMETDLHNVIKRGNILKDVHKRYIMYQMLKATKYIHSGNVIHRDQKPSNVLIDSACRVKIADFGLARSVSGIGLRSGDGTPDACLTDYVATRWYRAPEILVASKRYTKGIDMWSLGCILGEMLTGKPLFPGSSTVNQVERIMAALPKPSSEDVTAVCMGYGSALIRSQAGSATASASLSQLLSKAPQDAADLVDRLLVFNPTKRLSASDALEHDYVSRFHREKDEPVLNADVVLPLCDDKQLSVDDYRNKLYSLMSRGSATAPHSLKKAHTSKSQPSVSLLGSKGHCDPQETTVKHAHSSSLQQRHQRSVKTSNNVPSTDQKARPNKPHKAFATHQSTSHAIHVNNAHSESKISAQQRTVSSNSHVRSEHHVGDKSKHRLDKLLNRPVTSENDSNFLLNHQPRIEHWLTGEKTVSKAKGDFFQPVTRQSTNDGGYLSGGNLKKAITSSNTLKNKRNATSFSTVSISGSDFIPYGFNQKHGVITASALLDLTSNIR